VVAEAEEDRRERRRRRRCVEVELEPDRADLARERRSRLDPGAAEPRETGPGLAGGKARRGPQVVGRVLPREVDRRATVSEPALEDAVPKRRQAVRQRLDPAERVGRDELRRQNWTDRREMLRERPRAGATAER
jgi:hypothetical protein